MPCSVSNATAISSVKESFVYSDILFLLPASRSIHQKNNRYCTQSFLPLFQSVFEKSFLQSNQQQFPCLLFYKKRGFNCSYPTMRSKLRYNVTPGKIICISSFTSQTVIPFSLILPWKMQSQYLSSFHRFSHNIFPEKNLFPHIFF